MPLKTNPVRYAHTDGHTDVCYSEEGKYIVTCGNDGDIRVWLGLEDDDPTSHCVGENALALAQKGSKLYVGTDDNTLRCYKFPDMERDGVLTRFSKPVTHISVSPDGNTVAAASENSEIFVWDAVHQKIKTLFGHSGPVLSVAIDPKLEYLASSSGDGKVCVWEMVSTSVVQSWTCVAACDSFFNARVLCRVSWQSGSGQLLAVPSGNRVLLYERGTWQQCHVFSHPSMEKEVSISCFSPCGKFLAVSSVVGDIAVWDVVQKSCNGITKQDKKLQICALAWNPNQSGEVAFCDFAGQLGTVVGCVEEVQVHGNATCEEPGFNMDCQTDGVDSDVDDENAISLEKIKAQAALPLSADILDSASITGILGGREDDDDDRSVGMSVSELQPPFQPSATPHHLQHRFMVWNSVGIVRCSSFPEEVIDVEFHDTSTHHALHIRNVQHYNIASLTEQALVLACEGDTDSASKVMCVLLNCWDGTREWSVELPEGEGALCVACGSGWVAVATDARLLRVWTLAGAQREVVALPGPVLCLAQHAHKLLLTCHLGPGVCGDQNVGYSEMCMVRGQMSVWQCLPLAPRSSLQWLGFTDEGSPCLHDSSGSLRLCTSRGYWLPVLHTASLVKSKSDHYFVLGMSERYQNARAVLCKGSRYPPTAPRPTLVELVLKVGLADVSTDRGQLEELFWRSTLAAPAVPADEQIFKSAKEASIKLFAMACRAEQQARAMELCALMADRQVVQLALKYASKLGKSQLADRISQLDLSHLDLPARKHELEIQHYRDSPTNCNGRAYSPDGDRTDNVDDAHTEGRESFIVEASRAAQNCRESYVPVLAASQTRANPFKKCVSQPRLGRGLGNLASLPRSTRAVQSPTEDCTRQAQLPLQLGENQPTKASVLPVFVEWYPAQEAQLKQQFPHLSSQQLTKEALKRYKQLQRTASAPSEKDAVQEPAQGTEAEEEQKRNKRKLADEEKPLAKKPASASTKLTAFLFKRS